MRAPIPFDSWYMLCLISFYIQFFLWICDKVLGSTLRTFDYILVWAAGLDGVFNCSAVLTPLFSTSAPWSRIGTMIELRTIRVCSLLSQFWWNTPVFMSGRTIFGRRSLVIIWNVMFHSWSPGKSILMALLLSLTLSQTRRSKSLSATFRANHLQSSGVSPKYTEMGKLLCQNAW